MNPDNFFYPLKHILATLSVSVLYLLISGFLIGFKMEQLALVLIFNSLYYLSAITRKFILAFSVFIIFWIIFDSMKGFPNYLYNSIHVKDLYIKEKILFGMNDNGVIFTPNEYAEKHNATVLDIITGLFYLNWIPVPLLFAFYLFRKDKTMFLQFSLTFLLVNLIGFVIYYIFPAAPPWYIKQYGFDLHFNTPGNTAGLARFDNYFGINVFGSLYAKSSNVFAAMPSLHSAYPVVVLYYGLKKKLRLINLFFFVFMIGIWFSAVYSGHHYLLDVIAGCCCAITGILLFEKALMKTWWFNQFLKNYQIKIT